MTPLSEKTSCLRENIIIIILPFAIPRNEALSHSEVPALDLDPTDLGFKLKIWSSVGNFGLIPPRDG